MTDERWRDTYDNWKTRSDRDETFDHAAFEREIARIDKAYIDGHLSYAEASDALEDIGLSVLDIILTIGGPP